MIIPFYYFILIICIFFTFIVISAKNPIHRIASLVLVFLAASFLFMLFDNYFLGLTYIIVYVGAIAILFLFIIMLIDHPSVGYNISDTYISDNIDHNFIFFCNTKKNTKSLFQNKNEISILYNNKNNFDFYENNIFTLNIKDIIFSYSILSKKESKIIPFNPSFIFNITPYFSSYFIYNKYIIFLLLIISSYIFINFNFLPISINDFNIYTYFYPIWSIEYITFTDIQILGILIYLAYPLALILLSIALWTVMIGIISICSPRVN